jgi:LPXTG-site transpeptidase (sortase) family protein
MKKRSGVELKKSFDFRKIIIPMYLVGFLIYLAIGLLPAEAARYNIVGELEIPQINLVSDVAEIKIEDHVLKTPDTIVGSYSRHEHKLFLFGHASGIFKNLANLQIGDEIVYQSITYKINSMIIEEKSMINMAEVLQEEDKDTLVLMTCAGEDLGNGDSTHRLLVTATAE